MTACKAICHSLCGALLVVAGLLWPTEALAQALQVPTQLSTWDIAFYTFFISAIVFFFGAMLLLREYSWITYALYGFMLMLLFAALEGTLSVLFDGDPWMMGYAPLFIGSVTTGFGFVHTAFRIEAHHWLVGLRPLYLVFSVLGFSLIPGYYLLDSAVPLYATLNTLMMLMAVGQIFPPLTWHHLTVTQRKMALLWPMWIIGLGITVYAIHFVGPGFERSTLDAVNRLLLVLHVAHLFAFVGIAIADQMRAKSDALQHAQVAAREAAEADLARERSERAYEDARRIASSRSRQLASASHDLKQPIAALRHAIEAHREEVSDSHNERIHDAVNYLDQLANTYLELGTDALDYQDQELARDAEGREELQVEVLFNTLQSMFSTEASQAGLELRVFNSRRQIYVSPLAVTRALSNLISNALKHARAKHILLGCRYLGDQLALEVLDDGSGMSAQEIERAVQLRERGDDSAGTGLGLPIVVAMAEQQGWQWNIDSVPGRGTRMRLVVPAA